MTRPGESLAAIQTIGKTSRRFRLWRRRILAVASALFVFFGTCPAIVYYQHLQRAQLIAVIRDAGGKVRDDQPFLSRVQHWYDYGDFPLNSVAVNLDQADGDPAWLREHDSLRGLDIEMLASFEEKVTGADLARLIDAHPLKKLYVDDIELTDEIIAALHRKSTLEELSITVCTLSDEQFAALPLEQLSYLAAAHATVSPEGLLEFRRCEKLATLSLDGRQFTPEVAEILASLGTVTTLGLYGNEVTDDHLKLLDSIKSLKRVSLDQTTATPEGVAALQAALPDCEVEPP